MQLLTMVAVASVLAGAFALFGLKLETRDIERRVGAQERAAIELRREIQALETEHARLASPERVERLARAVGLQPIRTAQISQLVDASRVATAARGTTPIDAADP